MFNSRLLYKVIIFIDDATRLKFLFHLMTGTKEILQGGVGKLDYTCVDFFFSTLFVNAIVL